MSDIFRFETDPDDPEWTIWELLDVSRFNSVIGPMRVQRRDRQAVVRIYPTHSHSNFADKIHGGLMMGFIDCALFAASRVLTGQRADDSVTLECSTQFLAAGRMDAPLDAVIEVLRETGRFVFQRGVLEQEGAIVASFTAILRKASAPRP